MCSKRCHNAAAHHRNPEASAERTRRAREAGWRPGPRRRPTKPPPRPRPLLEGATIVLAIPSGRLKWVRCLHLLPDDNADAYEADTARKESIANDQEAFVRLRWNARYLAALKYATDKPKPLLNIPTETTETNDVVPVLPQEGSL